MRDAAGACAVASTACSAARCRHGDADPGLGAQVRAAGEGTTSPFYVRTNPYCYQQMVFKLAWRLANGDDAVALTMGGTSGAATGQIKPQDPW